MSVTTEFPLVFLVLHDKTKIQEDDAMSDQGQMLRVAKAPESITMTCHLLPWMEMVRDFRGQASREE